MLFRSIVMITRRHAPHTSPRRDCDIAGLVERFELGKTIGHPCGVALDGDRSVGRSDSNEALRGMDKTAFPQPIVTVSNFNAIPPFVKGTTLLSTEISTMHIGPLRELSMAPLPFESEPVSLYMAWHERSTNDPAHVWIRRRVEALTGEIF